MQAFCHLLSGFSASPARCRGRVIRLAHGRVRRWIRADPAFHRPVTGTGPSGRSTLPTGGNVDTVAR